jgi:hypothetical protein
MALQFFYDVPDETHGAKLAAIRESAIVLGWLGARRSRRFSVGNLDAIFVSSPGIFTLKRHECRAPEIGDLPSEKSVQDSNVSISNTKQQLFLWPTK